MDSDAVQRSDSGDVLRIARLLLLCLLVVVFALALLYAYRSQTPAIQTVPITQAVQDVQAGKVKVVTEVANKATLELADGSKEQTNLPNNSRIDPLQDAVTAYNTANPTRQVPLRYEETASTALPVIASVLLSLLPLVLFVVFIMLVAYAIARGRRPDRFEQLARIADLRDRGVLTEDEFQREKRRLLG